MTRIAALFTALAAATALTGCVLPGPSLYMDSQQQELEKQLAGTPVKVVRKGDTILLRMPNDVTFPFDKSEIAPDFFPVLDSMSQVIAKYDATAVQVTGHADSTGSDDYNQALSERRATSVGAYLAGKGVGHGRMVVEGRGENSPIASNETEEGRAVNRRVEVTLQPLASQPAAPPPLAQAGAPPQPLF